MSIFEASPLFCDLWKATLIRGILSLAVGVLVLLWPGISIVVAAVLFGVALVAWGVVHVVLALSPHVSVGSRIMLFISGAAALIVGVLAFRHLGHDYAVLLLAIWIAVGLIFQGTAETVTAVSYPAVPGRAWHVVLGVITLLAGVVMLAWPIHSIVMLALVAGVWLIVVGVAQVVSSLRFRSVARDVKETSHGSTCSSVAGFTLDINRLVPARWDAGSRRAYTGRRHATPRLGGIHVLRCGRAASVGDHATTQVVGNDEHNRNVDTVDKTPAQPGEEAEVTPAEAGKRCGKRTIGKRGVGQGMPNEADNVGDGSEHRQCRADSRDAQSVHRLLL